MFRCSLNLGDGIAQAVVEIDQRWKLSILLVEQNVREALKVAHRALALVDGEIALESEDPRELLTSGHLEQLFFGERKKAPRI